jgi:hypothetical protein
MGSNPAEKPNAPRSVGGSRTGNPTAVAIQDGDTNIGYLSSIPSDYRGYEQPASIRESVWLHQQPAYQRQRPLTWIEQAMQKTQAEVMALERASRERDDLLQRMQRDQQEMLLRNQR